MIALHEMGIDVHLLLDADYEETATLFEGWSVVKSAINRGPGGDLPRRFYDYLIPAVPPFYWPRVAHLYACEPAAQPRPKDGAFYRNEQEFYLSFARKLGFTTAHELFPFLPFAPSPELTDYAITACTVVLAPGCKTGEMALKRWPWYGELAARLPDVAIVGTADDLYHSGGPIAAPAHVRNFAGRLPLRRTAELLACAGVVVGNDSGLSHVAAAIGVPVIMIFGPTPDRELGPLPPNVRVLRSHLPCEPCWHAGRFEACRKNIDCLRAISVDHVIREIGRHALLTPLEASS